jgi:hypothetical protein
MAELSGPVGVRNGVTQVANALIDQGMVIGLLWAIDPANGGKKGVSPAPAAGQPKRCGSELATAIKAFQAFWVKRGEFRVADGVVDPLGRTWRKLVELAGGGGVAPTPPVPPAPVPGFTDLNVLRFQQTQPGVAAGFTIPSIVPTSAMPFLFTPVAKFATLTEGSAGGTVSDFLFKIEKNGATFWVGACVPAGTVDFSRAYIFFHPDTISSTDDGGYPASTGRWPTVRQRYVLPEGLQLAAVKAMPLIVPFMTSASRTNDPRTNLFADRGTETLDDILTAIQISLGRTGTFGSVQQVGVASFSSGVNHLFRFAEKLGASGLIREQIDFDSAFMVSAHKHAPTLPGVVNWMVTQSPASAGRAGWLYLPQTAFRNVSTMRGDTHSQIGFMMFQTMMVMSVVL